MVSTCFKLPFQKKSVISIGITVSPALGRFLQDFFADYCEDDFIRRRRKLLKSKLGTGMVLPPATDLASGLARHGKIDIRKEKQLVYKHVKNKSG